MGFLLAIDPGAGGALALFSGEGTLLTLYDMPVTLVTVAGKKRRRVYVAALSAFVKEAHPDRVVIEQVGSRPGESPVASFSFGRSVGVLEGVAGALGTSVHFVRPQAWKKHFHLSPDKAASRQRAAVLFPDHVPLFARVKDDGRAEAALIGLYAFQALFPSPYPCMVAS